MQEIAKNMYMSSVETLYSGDLGARKDCVPISGVEAALYQSIVKNLVPVACVHSREVSAIQGSGLGGCLQFRGVH